MFIKMIALIMFFLISSCNENSSSGNNLNTNTKINPDTQASRLINTTWKGCVVTDNGSSFEYYSFDNSNRLEVYATNYLDDSCSPESAVAPGKGKIWAESTNGKYQITSSTNESIQISISDLNTQPTLPEDDIINNINFSITFENTNTIAMKTTFLRWQDFQGNTNELTPEELQTLPIIRLEKSK